MKNPPVHNQWYLLYIRILGEGMGDARQACVGLKHEDAIFTLLCQVADAHNGNIMEKQDAVFKIFNDIQTKITEYLISKYVE